MGDQRWLSLTPPSIPIPPPQLTLWRLFPGKKSLNDSECIFSANRLTRTMQMSLQGYIRVSLSFVYIAAMSVNCHRLRFLLNFQLK